MYAIRIFDRCTKDCICLYVCPTGATDTETGQIDKEKCIGCGACVNACPAKAIVMLPEEYPTQQEKSKEVCMEMKLLAESKIQQERIAYGIAVSTDNPIKKQIANAISKSNRIMAEDLLRESGYMLPQSDETRKFLFSILDTKDEKFPKEDVEKLIMLLSNTEKKSDSVDNGQLSLLSQDIGNLDKGNIIKGTKTEENLKNAFSGESMARNKYTYYAQNAAKEGYQQIAELFLKTANNEREHAKLWFGELGETGKTLDNLLNSIEHEQLEWSNIYIKYAKEADEEGFYNIAEKFRQVANIEKSHEEKFKKLINNIEMQKVFEKSEDAIWECRMCGHMVMEPKAPKRCPVCGTDQSYFEVKSDNY